MVAKGLRVKDQNEGTGAPIGLGDVVSYHYDCFYPQGELLHSSRAGSPIESEVGSRDLCVGISHGLEGMREGGRRTIHVPPQLIHIERKIWPDLPNNLVLRYEIELLKVVRRSGD